MHLVFRSELFGVAQNIFGNCICARRVKETCVSVCVCAPTQHSQSASQAASYIFAPLGHKS